MELLVAILLVAGIVIFFATRPPQKGAVEQVKGDAGPQPDFMFKGQSFISLREASNKGGEYGMKFILSLFKRQRILRLELRVKKDWSTSDIDFDAIEGVKRMVLEAGEYGTYPSHLIVITTDGEAFPLREIILYPGEYKLLDALYDALGPDKVARR